MAHNINFNTLRNTHSFFSARINPWHSKGVVLENNVTVEEAIRLANLDYEVKLANIYAEVADGIQIPNFYSTYRTDTNDILGVVKSRYSIVQNSEAFAFFDTILDSNAAVIETAGVLGKGETVFITAKLPKSVFMTSTDRVDNYLVITTSHDGSSSLQIMFSPIRVVCQNTLAMALRNNSNKIVIKHTRSAKDNIQNAHRLMQLIPVRLQQVENSLDFLYNKKVNDFDYFIQDHIAQIFLDSEDYIKESNRILLNEDLSTRKKNIISSVLNYTYNGPGQAELGETAYKVYNGITGYFQNAKVYNSVEAKGEDNDKKVKSIFFGADAKTVDESYKLLTV